MLQSLSPIERDDVLDIARQLGAGRIDRAFLVPALTQVYAASEACITDHLTDCITEVSASRGVDFRETLESQLRAIMSDKFSGIARLVVGADAVSIAYLGKCLASLWLDHCRDEAEATVDRFIEQWMSDEEVAA